MGLILFERERCFLRLVDPVRSGFQMKRDRLLVSATAIMAECELECGLPSLYSIGEWCCLTSNNGGKYLFSRSRCVKAAMEDCVYVFYLS